MKRALAAAAFAAALAATAPAAAIPPAPSAEECRAVRAERRAPVIETYSNRERAPRVFAMQFKQELRHVASYQSFRTKIECSLLDYVVPRLAKGRPNVVAFNEDVGLMTIATGSRGQLARQLFGGKGGLSCEPQGVPCTTLGALALELAAYAPQHLAYRLRFGFDTPLSDGFVAATDTFVRGWMQVFSDMARRYRVYILGSNNQAPFRESTDPGEISLFRDPDLPTPKSVYVATSDQVFNEVFMWGPSDVRADGPDLMRNVVARNKKVPLTPIEETLQLSNGPRSGAAAIDNLRPYALPGTGAKIQFATSLPAFIYGAPERGVDPCSDTALYYMRCLDKLGANLVMQDEANPGRWPANGGGGYWQPLEWMRSTWRAAADDGVDFDYNVTPHMVGNLADLAFDGQTAITQRGLDTGRSCTYVGNTFVAGEDPEEARFASGPKPEFLAIAPWVGLDGPRAELRSLGARLAPGSGDPIENDYVETAIAADLPFPPDPARAACAVGGAPKVRIGTPRARLTRGGAVRVRVSCRVATGARCTGTLTGAGLRRTRVRLRPDGRAKVVTVRVGRLTRTRAGKRGRVAVRAALVGRDTTSNAGYAERRVTVLRAR